VPNSQLFIPAELIKYKRDGGTLTDGEIKKFVDGYTKGEVPDYQMSALLMAIFFRGMSEKETLALTQTMLFSGQILNLESISAFKVDKHSTGGVGDKTSLVVAPIVAAAGAVVPMISGRGLGHTGGTLDKLEAIPGFNTQLDVKTFESHLKKHGLCFIGQTPEICPADRKLYALRDVTGTVENIPLICASIMSKKLAEGIDGLVLDVKFGSGAFMKTFDKAKNLAFTLKNIGQMSGKKVTALLTSMDQPLGKAIGNSLEVEECIEILKGGGPADCRELCLELAAHMLMVANKATSVDAARKRATDLLDGRRALIKFEEIVKAQGGDLSKLPRAKKHLEIHAEQDGFVSSINTEAFGIASLILGGGRLKASDKIDPVVGITTEKKLGSQVRRGETLATLHFNEDKNTNLASAKVLEAYKFSLQKTEPEPLIKAVL